MSTNRCKGAFFCSASSTARMMRALIESAVALTVSVLSNASVPAKTREPTVFDAGIDSPVIIDSSMEPAPSSTIPSKAARSPGSMRYRDPAGTASAFIRFQLSPTLTVTSVGATSISLRRCEPGSCSCPQWLRRSHKAPLPWRLQARPPSKRHRSRRRS